MSATASVTVLGLVTGLQGGSKTIAPPSITSDDPVGQTTWVALSSGDNTISVPTGATAVVITPPSDNTAVLKLKGHADDVGIRIAKGKVTLLAFDTTLPTLIVNASATMTEEVQFDFI